ncbi:MAG: hypothetical protein CSB24_05935 [Deltaproteobacteria bacterium]|nr:MAG: hypothetical protein CSB24_05935 [Deltaproteobacteria bacterium]
MRTLAEMLEDEWYQVRYSGELPEIALNSSLYFLTGDKNGPEIVLDEAQILHLKHAARDRFQEIILRDLTPENCGRSIYRGLKRAMENWRRYEVFCSRQGLSAEDFRPQAADGLKRFLEAESASRGGGNKFNCSFAELLQFVKTLGLPDRLARPLCSSCHG